MQTLTVPGQFQTNCRTTYWTRLSSIDLSLVNPTPFPSLLISTFGLSPYLFIVDYPLLRLHFLPRTTDYYDL